MRASSQFNKYLLDYQDSNLGKQNQNLLCYHYTIVQTKCFSLKKRCKDKANCRDLQIYRQIFSSATISGKPSFDGHRITTTTRGSNLQPPSGEPSSFGYNQIKALLQEYCTRTLRPCYCLEYPIAGILHMHIYTSLLSEISCNRNIAHARLCLVI